MKTGNLLDNIKINNINLEKRYDILLKLIENEDEKSKSYYNNTLLLLTIESSIFISLIAGVILNYTLSAYETLALLLINVMIFFSIYCGLKCYRTSLNIIVLAIINQLNKTDLINLNIEQYLTQISMDFKKNNNNNSKVLEKKVYQNKMGLNFMKFTLFYIFFYPLLVILIILG